MLAIEDLSSADWVPRWNDTRIDAVRTALAELGAAAPPPNTRPVDGVPLRALRPLAGRRGRPRAVPLDSSCATPRGSTATSTTIVRAAGRAPVAGEALCHLDVRSDNLCFRDGLATLVDWNWTSFANPDVDVAAWLPSVTVEGGPQPWQVLPGAGELAAFVAGVWAAVAGLPAPETAPSVRPVQRAQLAVALDWLEHELELER